MLAHKAMYEGRIAVEAILGEPAEFDALAIPAVVFTDPEIAWAGVTEDQRTAKGARSRSPATRGPRSAGHKHWGAPKA